jgi:MFS family permease
MSIPSSRVSSPRPISQATRSAPSCAAGLIGRAGHIRTFAACAALVAAAFLGHALYFDPVLWAVLRALVGFGCAGLFVATESWLNAKATAATRGTVFAIYMVATYATFAGGQFMLNLASPTAFTLFALAAILFCLALALVTTTRAEQPLPVASSRLKAGELAAAAPVAVAGCFAGGLVSGSFYALVPVYAQSNGRSVLEILLHGDRDQRRPPHADPHRQAVRQLRSATVAGLSPAFAGLALAIAPARTTPWFPAVAPPRRLLSVIYPVCVAHANDHMPLTALSPSAVA